MILKYDTYSEDEFEQMREKLKAYCDRLDRGETIGERGGVLEFFRLYNTVVTTYANFGYEKVPESDCSSCTKRLRSNIHNYFTFFPIIEKTINNDSTNREQQFDGNQSSQENKPTKQRGRPKKD